MSSVSELYRPSLATLTDLYELTMGAGYEAAGVADRETVFALHFRTLPFGGGYAVAAGLDDALAILESLRFDAVDIDYLRGLRGAGDSPLFRSAFLDRLAALKFTCDVDAIPEGTVVFANEPLVRVRGPLLQAQLVESVLLNVVGFQTLVATKAARVVEAAGGPVLEFGLRRAQGPDGALSAARAAFIGGVAATSNVLAGRLYGIPVRGTHAHSWVQVFDDEQRAFDVYADAQPDNVTLLVDTYDSLAGVAHAIETGRRLEARGGRLAGIRLDSGDLAYLSVEARRMLDAAGFIETKIVASNDLDEYTIASLREQGARIDIWGVGTRLDTCYDQPALGAIYKLTAICNPDGGWRYPVKLSEHSAKISIPGVLGVRRFVDPSGRFRADMIYDEDLPAPAYGDVIVDPADALHMRAIEPGWIPEELVLPALRSGSRVSPTPSLDDVRARAQAQIRSLHPAIRRLLNPHAYPVGLERALHDRRTELVMQRRLAQPMG
ncbi:MAG TPA: nicotinate phosphoribosyltransferase [Candidatus Limnocylindrales bacterium]|jgi:nicotinate phosphoribosyltransferase